MTRKYFKKHNLPIDEGDFWTEGQPVKGPEKDEKHIKYLQKRDKRFHKIMDAYYTDIFKKLGMKY